MNHGELTPFVLQMLQYVSAAQDRVIDNLVDKSLLLEKSETALAAAEKTLGLSKGEHNLLYLLVQHDLFRSVPGCTFGRRRWVHEYGAPVRA
jgi:hypothetical protein